MNNINDGTLSENTEGDVNFSPRRQEWSISHIDGPTAQILAEDTRYFLHQSLSTPCLNVINKSSGLYLEDLQGRQIMDFHGNSVHQVVMAIREFSRLLKNSLMSCLFVLVDIPTK